PASSASFADNASWAPKTSAGPGRRSNVRKCAAAEDMIIVRKLYERGQGLASTRAREKRGWCSWTGHDDDRSEFCGRRCRLYPKAIASLDRKGLRIWSHYTDVSTRWRSTSAVSISSKRSSSVDGLSIGNTAP